MILQWYKPISAKQTQSICSYISGFGSLISTLKGIEPHGHKAQGSEVFLLWMVDVAKNRQF